ncbi:MAG: DedA family protein [Alphaproteobacteria bacterium]|nr:DedA family protein [Alphaproteobacteria bacterium]
MSLLSNHHHLAALLHQYGYGLVALMIGLESVGLPVPGESLLIAAALYAATTHQLTIPLVVTAAAVGAIVGGIFGYLIGRGVGYRLLRRYGSYVMLTPERLEIGRRLFARHGGKVVLFGRFVAVLRTLAALLAGANRMPWSHFLAANAVGGIGWASLYGFGAYALGNQIRRLQGPLGIAAGAIGIAAIAATILYAKRQERRLAAEAQGAVSPAPPC